MQDLPSESPHSAQQEEQQAIAQIAAMLAASENGTCCSGEDPPEPTPAQWEQAREWYAARIGKDGGGS